MYYLDLQHHGCHSDNSFGCLVRILLFLTGPFHSGDFIVDTVKVTRIGGVDASTILLHDEAGYCNPQQQYYAIYKARKEMKNARLDEEDEEDKMVEEDGAREEDNKKTQTQSKRVEDKEKNN